MMAVQKVVLKDALRDDPLVARSVVAKVVWSLIGGWVRRS